MPAITRLTLTDFRNYAALRLDAPAAIVALTGANGAGKTNLLEAISLLAPGRGLRGAGFDELARHGGGGSWAIAASVATVAGPVSMGTGWSARAEGDGEAPGRIVIIDGHVRKGSGAFGERLRLIWLVPAMDRLFAGAASDRRRFLDRLISATDPEHGSRVLVFEKVMRERNLLLAGNRPDASWLSSLEAHMAEAAIAIAAARRAGLEALNVHVAARSRSAAFPWAEASIEGEIEALLEANPAVRAEDEYRKMLHDSRSLDRAAGRTLRGPHRSDLSVIHGPKGVPAALCSTGEQKALLIGMILAQARVVKDASAMAPVLLLDEVAAHLDRARREGLFESLSGLGCQAWMTGTDRHLFEGLGRDAGVFHVEDGEVSKIG